MCGVRARGGELARNNDRGTADRDETAGAERVRRVAIAGRRERSGGIDDDGGCTQSSEANRPHRATHSPSGVRPTSHVGAATDGATGSWFFSDRGVGRRDSRNPVAGGDALTAPFRHS